MDRITETFSYSHPDYGRITVTPRRCSRNITARRKATGEIAVSVPYGADRRHTFDAVERLAERLRGIPQRAGVFSAECRVECLFGLEFAIERAESLHPRRVALVQQGHRVRVLCGSDVDLASGSTAKALSDLMMRAAAHLGGTRLLMRGREIAARLGANPSGWQIGHGRRTLGSCRADGLITLSAALLFLPQELADYVICHELAHLRHHDHSAAFHSLCDAFCGGREKELQRALRRYRWPILR